MNKPLISKETSKLGRFNVLTLTKDQHSNQYLADDLEYICLIPFDKSSENSIKSIYLLDYLNPATDSQTESLIIDTVNPDLDKTPYDSVCRALVEEAGLNIDELGLTENSIYYLGDIQMSAPMSYKMHCYGIDITSKSVLEFTRNLSKDHFTKDSSSIKKVGFHQVVNGDFPDSTILAGSFLLVSYFN
jgi:hypothetical protein